MEKVKWGEYKLRDLFEVRKGKRLPERVLVETKGNIALINQSTQNNMIARYSGLQGTNEIYKKNAITFGVNTKDFGYQDNDFYTIADVLFLKSEFLNEKNAQYFITTIKKQLPPDGWDKIFGLSQMKDLIIQLPTRNSKIDFEFMESFIAELEAERLAELNTYLSVSGLNNYTLTAEEQQVLADFETTKFDKFNVIDIFDVKNTGNLLSRDIIENSGETPYLCASTENNAVSSYISYDENYLDKGNCVFIGGKTFVVTYQEKDFYSNDSHNLVLHLKNKEEKNKLTQLYLATCINKSLKHKYSWGDSISNRKIQSDKVLLPVQNQQADYATMKTLISAIQKLVIKDVVLYADNKNSSMTINPSKSA